MCISAQNITRLQLDNINALYTCIFPTTRVSWFRFSVNDLMVDTSNYPILLFFRLDPLIIRARAIWKQSAISRWVYYRYSIHCQDEIEILSLIRPCYNENLCSVVGTTLVLIPGQSAEIPPSHAWGSFSRTPPSSLPPLRTCMHLQPPVSKPLMSIVKLRTSPPEKTCFYHSSGQREETF